MSDYIKLAEAPTLVISAPDCSACNVEVESDGDGWTCPVCGTSWNYSAGDDEPGTLYEEWAGEELDGDVVPNDDAWNAGREYASKQHRAIMDRLWAGTQ